MFANDIIFCGKTTDREKNLKAGETHWKEQERKSAIKQNSTIYLCVNKMKAVIECSCKV